MGGRPSGAFFVKVHFSPNKLAVPLQQRVRFEQEDDLTEAAAGAGGQSRQFAGEDNHREFVPAGNVWCVGMLALQNAELLPQKQNLDIFVMLSPTTQPDEVEQQRERVREKKEKHARWCCRDHAKRRDHQRERTSCGALNRLWRASDALSAPYEARRRIAMASRPCSVRYPGWLDFVPEPGLRLLAVRVMNFLDGRDNVLRIRGTSQ